MSALCLDKSIKFVGAVDSDGKLLAGEFNKYKFFGNNDTLTIKSSFFYLHYLIPALNHQQVIKSSGELSNNKNVFLFDLADLGKAVYLAVTALTERKDRYLCLYLELYQSSSEIIAHEEIISKISGIL
ncbi:MAG TPA: hypothetical protein VE643_05275 [Nitrososphaeraceae archaeon]|nr:hypothetical protein [Nitrososphaeraceae archaeon]